MAGVERRSSIIRYRKLLCSGRKAVFQTVIDTFSGGQDGKKGVRSRQGCLLRLDGLNGLLTRLLYSAKKCLHVHLGPRLSIEGRASRLSRLVDGARPIPAIVGGAPPGAASSLLAAAVCKDLNGVRS